MTLNEASDAQLGGLAVPGAGETEGNQVLPEKKSTFYADTALVRYRDDKQVKVLKDSEFIDEFAKRPNGQYWKTIEVIQTATKSKTGCGTPIFVHFFAPLNEEAPS